MVFRAEIKNLLHSWLFRIGVMVVAAVTAIHVFTESYVFTFRNIYQYSYTSQTLPSQLICVVAAMLAVAAANRDSSYGLLPLIAASPVRRRVYFRERFWPVFLFCAVLLLIFSFASFTVLNERMFAFPQVRAAFSAYGLSIPQSRAYYVACYFVYFFLGSLPMIFFFAMLGYLGGMLFSNIYRGMLLPIGYGLVCFIVGKTNTVIPFTDYNYISLLLGRFTQNTLFPAMAPYLTDGGQPAIESPWPVIVCIILSAAMLVGLYGAAYAVFCRRFRDEKIGGRNK